MNWILSESDQELYSLSNNETLMNIHPNTPTCPPHESPYGQTTSEQLFLSKSLEREALRNQINEIKLLELLFNNQQQPWLSQNDVVTLLSAWDSARLTPILPKEIHPTYLNAVSFLNRSPLEIDTLVKPTEHLIVANAHVASLLLLRPSLVKQLAQKIKKSFIFPHYINPNRFNIEWGETFSDSEYSAEHSWRWALASAESHSLMLTNNTVNTQTITLNLSVWLGNGAVSSLLKIYFLNNSLQQQVEYDSKIKMLLSVPPGRHRMSFVYDGLVIKSPLDSRVLHFAIVDLSIYSDQSTCMIERHVAYDPVSQSHLSPHHDLTIRNVLHESGFFEVSAIGKAFHGVAQKNLATTRFHVANQHYVYSDQDDKTINADVIWYFAKRTATLKEEL